jgi:hypothetical protein
VLLAAVGVLAVLGFLFLFSLLDLAGELSQQEREQYYQEHGWWPEW